MDKCIKKCMNKKKKKKISKRIKLKKFPSISDITKRAKKIDKIKINNYIPERHSSTIREHSKINKQLINSKHEMPKISKMLDFAY
jgi:hypothetical protein